MATSVNVQEFINAHPVSRFQRLILSLCFLVVAIDGFDTALVGFIAPAVQAEWDVGPAELTPLMMSGLFGLLVGAFVFGPLSDRFGRKSMLIATTVLFGLMSLFAGFSTDIYQLTLLRFLTGLGLGGALPNAITLCSEYSPEQRRASFVTTMVCGFSIGMAASGFVAAAVIPAFGWQTLLVIGGAIPLLLAPVLFLLLPESAQFLTRAGRRLDEVRQSLNRIKPGIIANDCRFDVPVQAGQAPSRQIFAQDLKMGTIALWCAFFMSLLIVYLIGNWLPLILGEAGLSRSQATLITTGFHLGGSVGAIILGRLMDRFNENTVLAIAYALAGLLILVASQSIGLLWAVAVSVVCMGFLIVGGQVGLNALASGFYPSESRGTGVSWANGVGRSGSIIGSFIGGWLLALNWGASNIFLLLACPALLAALAIFSLNRSKH